MYIEIYVRVFRPKIPYTNYWRYRYITLLLDLQSKQIMNGLKAMIKETKKCIKSSTKYRMYIHIYVRVFCPKTPYTN